MLSKKDINKELGKGINLVPFNPNNIKENSINLTTSKYAWPMSEGSVFIRDDGEVFNVDINSSSGGRVVKIKRGGKAVHDTAKGQVIILLPLSTTLIETEEVLAVDNYIAGTYHSKVGLVSQGIGHIGTMLGPSFSGHSLVAIHNISSEPIKLGIGESFVSVIFNYLNSPLDSKNNTDNGHLDKMSELGIILKPEERKNLNEDWKKSVETVSEKMNELDSFKKYKEKLKKQHRKNCFRYFSLRNSTILLIITLMIIALFFIAIKLDDGTGKTIWLDRIISIFFSGVGLSVFGFMIKLIKPKS